MGDSNFLGAPRLLQCCVVISSVAFIVHLIGISTPAWTVTDYAQAGLYDSGYIYAIVAVTSSVFTGLLAIIIQSLYAALWRTSFLARRWSWVFSFNAGLFTLLGVLSYGIVVGVTSRHGERLGYSFGLTLVSGILHMVPVVLLEVDRRQRINEVENLNLP